MTVASDRVPTTPLEYRVVVLAEDDVVLRRALSDFLASEGFLVREAPDLRTLERSVSASEPTALVLDVQLGDGDIQALVAELTQRPDRPHIVLISASAGAAHLARKHHVQLLPKPFELDALVQALLVPLDERTSEY